ncbi:MAG: GntR family transcriptional regulator [Carbonactinosporaceae bacterium]
MTSIDADARPLYEQVADSLRTAITRRELAPGDALPSEAELRERHSVSRDTVRKALAQLTQEGLLTGGQGRIRYVRSYAPLRWPLSSFESRSQHEASSDSSLDAWSTEVKNQGRRPAETIEVGIVLPPNKVAERLQLNAAEDSVVVRKRVRYADDKPYQLADSYFPEPLVRGTLLMEPRSVSAPGGVLASIGHVQVRYVDEISIRMPTKAESERLDLPVGTPVAEVVRTGFADDGTPLRVMVSIAPGDRNILVYELDAS